MSSAFVKNLIHSLLTPRRREQFKLMGVLLLRAAGLLVCTAVALLFCAIPFTVGVVAQLISKKKRVSNYLVGVIAAAAVFAVWWTTGWVQISFGKGTPAWISVAVSMYLGSVFAPIAAYAVRFFVQRQFLPKR